MSERKYYVLCENNCKFESMTKEQILAAITQAINEGTVGDCDTGFITRIQEQNAKGALKFWVGTQAEYNAIAEPEQGCFYIISDDSDFEDITTAIEALDKAVKRNETAAAQLQTHLNEPLIVVDDSTQAENKLQELFKKMPNATFARYYISTDGSYSVFELSKADNGWGHIERLNYGGRLFRTVHGGKDDNGNITYTFEPWVQFAPVQSPLEMQLGVEYALNEKYLGNTVYSKIISVNASAEVYDEQTECSSLSVNHGISNLAFLKSVSAINKVGDSFNDMCSFSNYGLSVNKNAVLMTYDGKQFEGTVYIELKYTKG